MKEGLIISAKDTVRSPIYIYIRCWYFYPTECSAARRYRILVYGSHRKMVIPARIDASMTTGPFHSQSQSISPRFGWRIVSTTHLPYHDWQIRQIVFLLKGGACDGSLIKGLIFPRNRCWSTNRRAFCDNHAPSQQNSDCAHIYRWGFNLEPGLR